MSDSTQLIEIEGDGHEFSEQVEKNARHLSAERMAGAGRRAVNRAARTARTHYSRGVRERLAMKASDVKDDIELRRATDTNPEATLVVSRQPVPLRDYGAKQRQSGVSVRVTKQTGRTILDGSFTVGSIGGHVFMRDDDVGRLPIGKLWGPSVGSQHEHGVARARPEAERVLQQRLEHEIGRQIEQANR